MSKKVQTFHDYMQSIINSSSPKKINKRGNITKGDYQTGLFGGGKSPAQQAAEQAAAQRTAQRAAEQAQRRADAQANQRAAQARETQQTQRATQGSANGAAQAAQAGATKPVYSAPTGNGAAAAAQLGNTTDPEARRKANALRDARQRAATAQAAAAKAAAAQRAGGNVQGGSGIGQWINDSVSNVLRNFATTANAQGGIPITDAAGQTATAQAATASAQAATEQAGTPIANNGTPTAVPTETTVKPEPTATVQGTATNTAVLSPTPSPLVTRTIEDATKRGARDTFNGAVTYVNGVPYVNQKALETAFANYKTFYPNSGVDNYAFTQLVKPPTQFPETLGELKWDDNSTVFRPAYDKEQSKAIAQNLITYMKTGSKGDGTPLTSNKDSIQPTDFPTEVLQEIAFQASGNAPRGFSREAIDKINGVLTAQKENADILDAAQQKTVADEVRSVGDWGLLAGDPNTNWFTQNIWNPNTQSFNENSTAYDVARMQNENNKLSNQRTRAAVLNPIQQTVAALGTPDDAAQGTAWARITPTAEVIPTRDNTVATAAAAASQTAAAGGGGDGNTKNQPRSGGGSDNTTIIGNGPTTAASNPYSSIDRVVYPRDDKPVSLSDLPHWTNSVPYLNNAYKNGARGFGSKEDPLILPLGMKLPQNMIDEWRQQEGRYIQNPNISVVPNTGPTRTPLNPNVPTGPGAVRLQNEAIANENKIGASQTAQAAQGNYVQTATPEATATPEPRVWNSGGQPISSRTMTPTPTRSVPIPTQTAIPTATPTQSASLDAAQQEIAQILNNQRTMQQQAASAFPQFAATGPTKQARMSPSKKTKKLKKDIGVGTGLTAHATQPVPESPMPKIRTTYGSYKFKKPQQQRSAKYGEDQQLNQPIRKQINAVQPRQTMQNVMQFPPSDAFQPFAKMIGNPMDKYEKNNLTKSLQQTSKYNNAYSNEKYKK